MRSSSKNRTPSFDLLFLATILLGYLSIGAFLQQYWLWGGLILSQVGILWLPAWLLRKKIGLQLAPQEVQRFPRAKEVLYVLLLTTLVIFMVEVLTQVQNNWWPLPETVENFYIRLKTIQPGWSGLLQFFSLVVVPAICEELFFRGWLQSSLERSFIRKANLQASKPSPVFWSIILTALIFAVVHLNPWYFPQYFLLGLYFSWLKAWKNQVGLCIIAHFLNNLMSVYGNF